MDYMIFAPSCPGAPAPFSLESSRPYPASLPWLLRATLWVDWARTVEKFVELMLLVTELYKSALCVLYWFVLFGSCADWLTDSDLENYPIHILALINKNQTFRNFYCWIFEFELFWIPEIFVELNYLQKMIGPLSDLMTISCLVLNPLMISQQRLNILTLAGLLRNIICILAVLYYCILVHRGLQGVISGLSPWWSRNVQLLAASIPLPDAL